MKYFNLSKDKSKQLLISVFSIPLLILLVWGICKYNQKPVLHTTQGFYFDTVTQISIYDDISDSEAEDLFAGINKMFADYENLFSRTKEGSDIYRVNHSDGNEVSINYETATLLSYALDIAQKSGGLVDPTIGALSSLWNIGSSGTDSIPTDTQIKEALSTVNYQNVILTQTSKGYTIRLNNPSSMLDLGFVAKGYIADKAKDYLLSKNIKSAVINLGGNVLTIGSKPGKDSFNIGIKNPDNTTSTIHTVSVNDKSVVSSGDYERYIEVDGQRYHHILSTQTGYPAESDIHQVTIISDSSLQGDALSTLCFILGKQKASEYIKSNYPDVEILF